AAILEQSYQEALAADFLYVALNSLNNLQVADRYMGRSREAHADVDRLRGLHLETADLIAIQLSVGIAEQEGELEKALGLAREYVEASDRQGNPRHLEVAHWLLAHLLVMLGRLDEARRLIVTPEPDKSLQL